MREGTLLHLRLDRNNNNSGHLLDFALVFILTQIPLLVLLETNKVVVVMGSIKEGLLLLLIHGIAKIVDGMGGLGVVVNRGQDRGQEEGADPEGDNSVSGASNEIDDVVVTEVHGSPPDPEDVADDEGDGTRTKDVDEKESQLPGTGRVEGGESAKDERGSGEG